MNKILKRTLCGLIGLATISGTYLGRHGDLPPIYSHKTKDSYGINAAIYTKIDSGAVMNGINISLFCNIDGTLNGLNASLANFPYSGKITGLNLTLCNAPNGNPTINGANLTLLNMSYDRVSNLKMNGLEFGLCNVHGGYVNGIQIGGMNIRDYDKDLRLNGVQIGIYNVANNNKGILLNIDSDKR